MFDAIGTLIGVSSRQICWMKTKQAPPHASKARFLQMRSWNDDGAL